MKNKKLIAIFAVALAILIMGMGAYAANVAANLLSEQLREAFGRAGVELDKDELNALESIGSNGNPSITSDGTTMEVTAAVYETKEETIDHLDNDGILVRRETYSATHYYLALKITAPEGMVLDCGDSYWQLFGDNWPDEDLFIRSSDGELFTQGSSAMFSDDVPGDNELTVIVEFSVKEGCVFGDVFGDGNAKILRIPGLWLQSEDKEYTKILDGEWVFDLEEIGVNGAIPATDN